MPLPPTLSAVLAALALVMAAVFVLGVRDAGRARGERPDARRRWTWAAAALAAAYLGVSGVLAAAGLLADLDARPPSAGLLLLVFGVGTVALGLSRVGDRLLRLPLAVLVGAQSFRVLVELWLLAAYRAGSVPVEMTAEGLNLDLVTGLTAAVLGVWLWWGRPPRGLVVAWNLLGLGLLVVVVAVAATSAFGVVSTSPRLAVPAGWPGVWLPAWLVQLALLGHVLVFRALARPRRWG